MLDDSDIELIKTTRQEIMSGRLKEIEIRLKDEIDIDSEYNLPLNISDNIIPLSGTVSKIREEDRILSMGGKLNIGDTKVTFYYDDIVGVIDLEKLLKSNTYLEVPKGSGKVFIVDAIDENGIGTNNRVVLGLLRNV